LIIIIATLIIGFVLGMLTSAQIRYHRLNPVRMFFSEERFREGFYRTVQPDEQQKAKIDLVLDKYARITGDLQHSFRKELDSTMREFRKEIDTYLTKDQISRLREMDERRQKMIQHNRMMHTNDSADYRGDRHHFHEGMPPHGDGPYGHPPGEPDPSDSVGNK
jgi:hypothetical protein